MSVPYSKWIELNVGGQCFQTTLTTLLSCPDSLLAKMFDPESGLQPAYSKDGVYFLDANPKYFSVILDWLRYKEVMAGSDVNLSNVVKAAKFFGLQEFVVALENKQLADELKKTGAVVIVGDGSMAYKKVGSYMGFYLKQTDIAYRQAGGEMCQMYLYQARDGVWHVNDQMDGKEGYLRNKTAAQARIVPNMGWEYYSRKDKRWIDDEELKIVVAAELKMCNSITLSCSESKCEEFLGKYERSSGDFLNGWPVFKNQKGNLLQVPLGTSHWTVGDCRDCEEAGENNYISSDGVTTCPAFKKRWTASLYGPGFYSLKKKKKEEKEEKWKIICDVHENAS